MIGKREYWIKLIFSVTDGFPGRYKPTALIIFLCKKTSLQLNVTFITVQMLLHNGIWL